MLPTVLKETGSVGGTSGEKKGKIFPEVLPTLLQKRAIFGGVYKEMCDLA